MINGSSNCELCDQAGGTIVWRSGSCRIIRVDDPAYPGFCRVIWNAHIREMTDLNASERQEVMRVVFAVEEVVRHLFSPDKINLASFGNMVPHLHWHIIPRWCDDRHFPEPIWGQVRRDASVARAPVSDRALAEALAASLGPTESAAP